MKHRFQGLRMVAGVIALLFPVPASGLALLDDPFSDGSRTNATGGDTSGAVWFTTGPALTVADDSAGIGSGNALRFDGNAFNKLMAFFHPVTLSAAGQSLALSFDYRFTAAPTSAPDGFRVGLGNSNNTRQTADGGNTIRYDDWNYGLNTNPGLAGGNTRICQESAGDETLGGGGAGQRTPIGTAGGGIASGTTKHNALLRITRQADGGLAIESQIDNEAPAVATHPAASVLGYAFDQVLIGYGNAGGTISIDNVRVTLTTANGMGITASDPAASEAGLDPGSFTVTRDNVDGAFSLPYIVSGTATAGADYHPLAGTIEFAAGQGTAALTLTPMEDWFIEDGETIAITLLPSSGTTAFPSSATVTIADNPSQTIPSDALFFSRLDLARPGLAAVHTAVAANDFPAARTALATYFRTRSEPAFPTPDFTPDATRIHHALDHRYTIVGINHDFEPEPVTTIDWSFNPTNPVNNEWPWQFNRHDWWDDLARKHQINPAVNTAYLDELLFEIGDWITTSPAPERRNNSAGSRWRTIEAGIRASKVWPDCFYRIKSAPRLTDDLLVLWLKSFYMHARLLRTQTAGSGNWVAHEGNGLFTIGVIFPEFLEAQSWRNIAVSRLVTLMQASVLADGSSDEFSPGYHDVMIEYFARVKELAMLNKLPLSADSGTEVLFNSKLESLYDYMMRAMEPDGNIPTINDSWSVDVRSRMAEGAALFPARQDFRWIANSGAAGSAPAGTSHLFPDAGQIVMRSGWGAADNYLLMDAGPFGQGTHQHEDKLSINVSGHGTRHVIDCGTYDYDSSIYRAACLGSRSNSQPLVDGLEQNRRSAGSGNWNTPTPVAWKSSAAYDYAAASYGEESFECWGGGRPAITRRHVFFMKPDVWVVIDAFKALDASPHTYSSVFHCNDDTVTMDPASQRVTVRLLPGEVDPHTLGTIISARPSLTITPLLADGQTSEIIKGQDSPDPFGYLYVKDQTNNKRPIPSLRYHRTVTGDTQMAYVLAAAPANVSPRIATLTRVATAGDTYGITMSFGAPGDETTFLVGLNGEHTTWKGVTYPAPSLIVTRVGVYDWDAGSYVQIWDGNGNPSTSGNWSVAPNWDGDVVAPGAGHMARLGNTDANRTVVYDSAASGTLGKLEFQQSSAFSNTLEIRKNLTITDPVMLGAAGNARIHVLPAGAADINLSADVTVNSGGLLSLGAFNPEGGAAVNTGRITGNVIISGGRMELSDVVKEGVMAASATTTNTVAADLSMSGGAISFVNAGYTDRRFQVTGNLHVSGGAVVANHSSGAGFYLSGASNVLNANSFESAKISMVLQAIGNQSLSTSNALGVIVARGSGTKTFTTSAENITQIQIMDGNSSAGMGTTFRLGSNLTASLSPSSNHFGNNAEAGRIDLGIDTNGHTLNLTAAGGWTPNASSQANHTVWNLTGAGSIRANTFNFTTAGLTTNLAANTTLIAAGGNSSATDLGGVGAIDSNSIFRYSGTAATGTPATLTSNRNLGDLEVTSGALKVLTGSNGTMQHLRVSGGILDLDAATGRTFASISLTGGTLANGTYATAEANYTGLQAGMVSGRLTGTKQLLKNTAGTLILSGANDHTGNTIVDAGTLHLAASGRLMFVPAASSGLCNALSGNGMVILDGSFAIDTTAVASLDGGTWTLEDVVSLTGPYGATFRVVDPDGSPWADVGNDQWTKDAGARWIWTFTETTGVLTLATNASAYETWATSFPGFTQTDPALDQDHDGLANLLEFVLGGDPTLGQVRIAPSVSENGSDLRLVFKRSDASELAPAVTVRVQTSTDLVTWTDFTTIGAVDGEGHTVAENGPAPDTIVVTMPHTGAMIKFARVVALHLP